jgi:drug/metabolite transporter (DMT)-like permease
MRHSALLGAVLTLLAAAFYSSLTVVVKSSDAIIPLPVLVFLQSAGALLLFIPILLKNGIPGIKKIVSTKKLGWLTVRAFSSLGISYLLFTSVLFIPLVNATLLANTSPLILPIIAYLVLSEKINHRLWVPLITGFIGVTLVLQPTGHLFHPAAFLAFGSAVCIAGTSLIMRKLVSTESNETIMFYFFVLSTVISGLIAIKFWVPLTLKLYLIGLLAGALYFSCQYLLTVALRVASAQLVTTLLYANIIFSAIFSMVIWHTVPNELTLFGILLTVFSGIICIRIEHQNHQKRISKTELEYV